MPQARNEQELRNALDAALQKAVNYVVQKIWNENREVVRVVVYEAYNPEEYERTGEFREAWEVTQETHNTSGKDAYGKFYYEPNNMTTGSVDYGTPDYAQHIGVGPKFYGDASREYLADIIYGAIKWGGYFGDNFPKKRDAWTELNKRIGKRKLKQWMKEGMKAAGLNVTMHNTAISMTED